MFEPTMELLDEVADEVRLTFHALVNFAAATGDHAVDPSARAVLEFLHRSGPTPVPDIARRRGVTRQHIQTIVNGLTERELVATEPNPAHRRSHLIALTEKGAERITDILADERHAISPLLPVLDPESLRTTIEILATVREHLDRTTEPAPERAR